MQCFQVLQSEDRERSSRTLSLQAWDGFKSAPPLPCFKEGGQITWERSSWPEPGKALIYLGMHGRDAARLLRIFAFPAKEMGTFLPRRYKEMQWMEATAGQYAD